MAEEKIDLAKRESGAQTFGKAVSSLIAPKRPGEDETFLFGKKQIGRSFL